MKLYVYILKRLDLKRFEILKVYLLIADHSFHIFFLKDIGYITEYWQSHI